ncbi:MAG: GxxExxY protein [Phycisphaerae bacterium]|nr:GxxExxY protein [Phycisphaerae bacterium]
MVVNKGSLVHGELTGRIIGAAMEVHTILGAGFLESVYEESLAVELKMRKILFEKQKIFEVLYKGIFVKQFACDFVVDKLVIVELKAIKRITDIEQSQLLNYLKVSGLKWGFC